MPAPWHKSARQPSHGDWRRLGQRIWRERGSGVESGCARFWRAKSMGLRLEGEEDHVQRPMRFDFLLSFDGRIKRKAWWLVVAPIIALNLMLNSLSSSFASPFGVQMLSMIISLALIWPLLAVSAKRWHDRNKSGLWTLVNIVPIIGLIWMVVECGCLKGSAGENEYGPEPV